MILSIKVIQNCPTVVQSAEKRRNYPPKTCYGPIRLTRCKIQRWRSLQRGVRLPGCLLLPKMSYNHRIVSKLRIWSHGVECFEVCCCRVHLSLLVAEAIPDAHQQHVRTSINNHIVAPPFPLPSQHPFLRGGWRSWSRHYSRPYREDHTHLGPVRISQTHQTISYMNLLIMRQKGLFDLYCVP